MDDMPELWWERPQPQEIQDALKKWQGTRPKQMMLTMQLKLRVRSKTKEKALLRALRIATNMTARLLSALEENAETPRSGGAFECMYEMLSEKAQGKAGNRSMLLGRIIAQKHRDKVLTAYFPLSKTLREGVFRECARMVLLWYQSVTTNQKQESDESSESQKVSKSKSRTSKSRSPKKKTERILTVEEAHQVWYEQYLAYQRAGEQEIPFGIHRGKLIKNVGKREWSWILERLIPIEKCEATLAHIEVLLSDDPELQIEQEESQQVLHPWRRISGKSRTVHASRLAQHVVDTHAQFLTLGELNDYELQVLRDELLELRDFALQFATIREAIELYLYKPVPKFPHVTEVEVEEEKREQLLERYIHALDALSGRDASNKRAVKLRDPEAFERLEASARARLLKVDRSLSDKDLQPLSFIRSIQPRKGQSQYSPEGFSLLYDSETLRYIFAAHLGNLLTQPKPLDENHRLHFVCFPTVKFKPPQKPILIFPVESGFSYQDELLQVILSEGRVAKEKQEAKEQEAKEQQEAVEQEVSKETEKKPRPGVKSTLGSAKLIHRLNASNHSEFFVHLSVRTPLSLCKSIPSSVVGFHEHANGYSYAIVNCQGNALTRDGRPLIGDLLIRDHVQPKPGDGSYSKNYVYEVANAIVQLALSYNALIGLEDTTWQKAPKPDREANRKVFARPSKEILAALQYKALLEGLARPWSTSGVSPSRFCSTCDRSYEKGQSGNRVRPVVQCFLCASRIPAYDSDQQQVTCPSCTQIWNPRELVFTCDFCGSQQLARYNTALVVAQLTMQKLVNYYDSGEEDTVLSVDEVHDRV